ncbi:MAG TPA: dihydropteroate synthase [Clostridiales bacterium]|nr:dihydropteroate synthase [Clostridiales bacterium]
MSKFNVRIVSFDNAMEIYRFNERFIKPSDYGARYMAGKAGYLNIYADNIRDPGVQVLKESLLSLGGEVVTHHDVLIHKSNRSAVLMMAREDQFKVLVRRLKMQDFGLPRLADEIKELLHYGMKEVDRVIAYDGGELVFGERTLVMGILNCTPDSFSDGGKWMDVDAAVEHALAMAEDGADIIDIGGESTRPYPGKMEISAAEEMERVLPVIEKLRGKLKVPISIDSYKAETVQGALKAGAKIINDVWGFQYDQGEMAAVAAKADCPVILMHNKNEAVYDNFMAEVTSFLRKSIDIAVEAGCDRNKIIVDPGFGFGKNLEHNLLLTNKLAELKSLNCPLLMAASRKKSVGLVLDAPADQRLMGDAAVTAISIVKGADMIRVHDVKEMVQVAKMADAIAGKGY